MNPVSLPVVWAPQQQPAPRVGGWLGEAADAGTGTPADDRWSLQRRCALTPSQFGACLAGLVLVSALVAGFFWAMGARFVTLFAGLEVLVVGLAFAWHALHAADGERLHLADGQLHIEQRQGLQITHEQVPLSGLRVTAAADGSIELNARGRRWTLGRQAAGAARRQALAGLRRAVSTLHG